MRILLSAALLLSLAFPALAEIKTISAPEALAAAKKGEVVLVDIRQPEEWKQSGVAEGAKLIPMRHPEGGAGFVRDLLAAAKGDRNAPIALICRTGNRSGATAKALADAGFTHILDVSEGMAGSSAGPGWIRRDLPMVRCPVC
ncbi:Putative Rhodanese-related sulfurtransferase(Rhodanese-like domain,1-138) [Magnetospirillum sp. XM-1]|uniref:rhodanese-like domain-containing protein n=1 Tax=Magnetospirillum sp. XM-1 TaxID=1663591 RepID=UPI00073DE944|nr:rhodanese-like domain-containing protein [Magnetospirillum sp. XM-1]CUW38275.1 Putative Rhodanese-related sulfurtransferase(Rhodanese-like domain,1-138) [Magnetospirillum sp. XM-1]